METIKHPIFRESLFFALIVFVSSVSGAQPLLGQPTLEDSPLRVGERLEYSVKVRGIPAGTQVMQVSGMEYLSGHEVYHVESASKARKFFNMFYAFDDKIESFIHSKDIHPLLYRKRITDGGYSGKISIDFDRVNQVARIVRDQKHLELRIPEGIQDELSMIYLLRTREMEVGQTYEFPALLGTKLVGISVAALRLEKRKTALGTRETIVVESTPKNVTMWLTNDDARVPVRIEADTKIGKLVCDLREMH